jgi:hypothetical protein
LTQSFVAGLVPVAQGSPRITLGVSGHLFANADDRAARVVEAAFGAALTECERDRWNPPLISMAIRWQFVVLPSDRHDKILKYQHGWVAEWFKAPVLKFAAARAVPYRLCQDVSFFNGLAANLIPSRRASFRPVSGRLGPNLGPI